MIVFDALLYAIWVTFALLGAIAFVASARKYYQQRRWLRFIVDSLGALLCIIQVLFWLTLNIWLPWVLARM